VHRRPPAPRGSRGPRPPDAIIKRLQVALEADLDDPTTDGRPGHRWRAALLTATGALLLWARRGVVQVLPAARNVADPDARRAWESGVTAAVNKSVRRARARGVSQAVLAALAAGVVAAHVLREHARLVQAIARAAGSDSYIWITRKDTKVRHLHVLLEGTTQRWDDPPLAGEPDFFGHPGDAAECRCNAWPIAT